MNLAPGRAVGDAIAWGPFRFPQTRTGLPERIDVGVRPEHVHVLAIEGSRESGERATLGAPGEIAAVEPLGAETHLVARVEGDLALRAIVPRTATFARGDAVRVAIEADRVMLFEPDESGGARLA